MPKAKAPKSSSKWSIQMWPEGQTADSYLDKILDRPEITDSDNDDFSFLSKVFEVYFHKKKIFKMEDGIKKDLTGFESNQTEDFFVKQRLLAIALIKEIDRLGKKLDVKLAYKLIRTSMKLAFALDRSGIGILPEVERNLRMLNDISPKLTHSRRKQKEIIKTYEQALREQGTKKAAKSIVAKQFDIGVRTLERYIQNKK
jgi:hypothetical protein